MNSKSLSTEIGNKLNNSNSNSNHNNSNKIYLNSKDKENMNFIINLSNKINNSLKLINQKKTLKYEKLNFKNKICLIKYHKSHNEKLLINLKSEILDFYN